MTKITSSAQASVYMSAERHHVEAFVKQYLSDIGVGVHITELIARELFGKRAAKGDEVADDTAKAPVELYNSALTDLVGSPSLFGPPPEFDIQRVIEGAASLAFMVRWAKKVDSAIIPREVIPSDRIVEAALFLFHEVKQSTAQDV